MLFFTIFSFVIWVLLDSVFWAANRSDVIMFVWSLQILVEPLVYIGAFYLIYLLACKKDIPFYLKIVIGLIYLPVVIFAPSHYTLTGFDLTSCLSTEGFFGYYDYVIEFLFVFWFLILAVKKYHQSNDLNFKKQLKYITIGIFFFLFSFSWGNIISSFTDDWQISQIGLFAMPIFIAFLVYSIIKFKTFNIKLISAQALVAALIVLIASQFIFIQIPINQVLNGIALLLIIIFGYFLIKSVQREIEQRERLEQLRLKLEETNISLESANEQLKSLDALKTEFLSLASHQLRSPLTAIIGYTSMLLDGSFGKISDKQNEAIDRVYQSSRHLAKVVEDLLNVSKIEQGGMQYIMKPFDFEKASKDLATDLSVTAEKKGLKLTFETDGKTPYMVNGDMEKIRQVILNFIDNSIKYTKEGSIKVLLSKDENTKTIKLSIKDTGMGMTPENKAKLFQKFARAEGGKMNAGGSGLGLYLAKKIIEEGHKGKVGVDSEGENKGSTFWMELLSV
ncbi:MAG: ATP-binding protein [Patescibacteria group bacterium]